MKRIYHINEDYGQYDIQEAIDAVIDAGIFSEDEIDHNKSKIMKKDDFCIGSVCSTIGDSYQRHMALYMFDQKKILTDGNVVSVYSFANDPYAGKYWVFDILRTKDTKGYKNIITKDGVLLDEMSYNIVSLNNGLFVVSPLDGDYVCDMKGNEVFGRFEHIETLFDDYKFLYINRDPMKDCIVDMNFNIIVDNIEEKDEHSVKYREDHSYLSKNREYWVLDIITSSGGFKKKTLYGPDMNIILDDIEEVEEIRIKSDDNINLLIVLCKDGCNIVGEHAKPMFEKQVKYINADFVGMRGCFMRVESFDKKYNIVLGDTLDLLDDKWFDEIVPLDEITGYKDLVAMKRDGKCNIIHADQNDLNTYLDYIFDEPVDNIYRIGDDDELIIAEKDGKSYLLMAENRMLEINPNDVYDSNINVNSYNHVVYIKCGEKMDIIRTDSDKTFCEEYLRGKKLDMILDLDSNYPVICVDGKYTYVNLEMFRPAIYEPNGSIMWFDDAELSEYDEDTDKVTFNVVYKGEKRTITQ